MRKMSYTENIHTNRAKKYKKFFENLKFSNLFHHFGDRKWILSLIDDLTKDDSQTDIKTDRQTKHFPDLFHLLGDRQIFSSVNDSTICAVDVVVAGVVDRFVVVRELLRTLEAAAIQLKIKTILEFVDMVW